MVGEGREEEGVITQLLDVETHPCRCVPPSLAGPTLSTSVLEWITPFSWALSHPSHSCRPAYNMVSDLPLNLYSTQFEGVEWRMSEYAREHVIR